MAEIVSLAHYITGTLQLAAVALSIVMILLAVTIIEKPKREQGIWRLLIIIVVLFALVEFIGFFKSFSIFLAPGITHIIPTIILILLICALQKQLLIKKGLGGK